MNDANNAGTLLPCPFCNQQFLACFNGSGNPDTKAWILECSSCAVSFHADNNETQEEVLEWWNTRVLSTPNAPVEPAGLRSLRHLLAHMPDKDLRLRRFDAQQLLQFINAILAVRLDEAAIRKDEREKCLSDLQRSYPDHAWLNAACAAIRNGGKQP